MKPAFAVVEVWEGPDCLSPRSHVAAVEVVAPSSPFVPVDVPAESPSRSRKWAAGRHALTAGLWRRIDMGRDGWRFEQLKEGFDDLASAQAAALLMLGAYPTQRGTEEFVMFGLRAAS